MRSLIPILLIVTAATSQGIVSSKDSLWVCNNLAFSRSDAVIITNNTSGAVWIDSAVIEFDILDTVGVSHFIANDRLETVWDERYKNDSAMQYVWSMTQGGINRFLLKNKFEGTSIRKSGTISTPGDSIVIGGMEIGYCFVCASMPRYPKYLRGMLFLYFNEGRIVSIRLYSNDLRTVFVARTGTMPSQAAASPVRFLINGRMLTEQHTLPGARRTVPMYRSYNFTHAQ